jgi:[ribosomal protein S5]-alanine N-acetyltransferase
MKLKTVETERLLLRPMTLADADFILKLLNEPSFIRNIGDRRVRTMDDACSYIQNGPLKSYEKHGFGLFTIVLRETGESIGMCGLIKRDTLEDVDIGYALLPGYWSRGYALEAASAIRDHARDVIGLKRLVAIVDPTNASSIRVLEKLGMQFEGMVRLSPDDIELRLFVTEL